MVACPVCNMACVSEEFLLEHALMLHSRFLVDRPTLACHLFIKSEHKIFCFCGKIIDFDRRQSVYESPLARHLDEQGGLLAHWLDWRLCNAGQ